MQRILLSCMLPFLLIGPSTHAVFTRYEQKMKKYLGGGALEQIDLPVQEAPGSDNHIIRKAELLKRPGARATIIVCHGYMCSGIDARIFRSLFPHYNVLIFDFRAHGRAVDARQCCTFGKYEALDVIAAGAYIRNRPDLAHLPVGVYGFSMGAVASIHAQSRYRGLFDFLILDCPYNSTENVIKTGLESIRFTLFGYSFGLPGRTLLEHCIYHPSVQGLVKTFLKTVAHLNPEATNTHIYPLNPAHLITRIDAPCFIIHCKDDDKIPAAAAYELFANARGYKRLWLTNGRRHFDSFFYFPEKYAYKVNRFVAKVLNGSLYTKSVQKISEDPIG